VKWWRSLTRPNQTSVESLLRAAGVSQEELDAAIEDGTLEWLAVDYLVLPEPPKYSVNDLAEQGYDVEQQKLFWRALGFADVADDDVAFGDTDVEMLELVRNLLEAEQVDLDVALQMTRVMGSSIARIAASQVDTIEAGVDQQLEELQAEIDDEDSGVDRVEALTEPFIVRAGQLMSVMPQIMDYTWRRHLQAAARRKMVRGAHADGESITAVGFADIVGFTTISQQLDEKSLAAVVDRFEKIAYDTVAAMGGRVIKTIGDEVMFAVEGASEGVDVAMALAETYGQDDALGDVRVGLAAGPVLEKDGDLYGPVVNLASRMVELAYPGTVVVSPEVAAAVDGDEGYELRGLRKQTIRGMGRVKLYAVRAVGDASELSTMDRARLRRRARREWIAGRHPSTTVLPDA
jgi:adenylate cyclase